jgi:hypothetical protein
MAKRRGQLTLVPVACERDTCPIKGEIHPKCKAHTRKGKPCSGQRMAGQLVCRMHGGSIGAAKATAKKRIERIEVEKLAARIAAFNSDDSESPEEGLLRQVLWSGQISRALGQIVQDIDDGNVTQRGIGGSTSINVLMQWWSDERALHARLCKLAIDAGIDQRHIELLESQAGQIVSVIINVLQSPKLGLSTEQITEGRIVAAEALRALTA